MPASKGTILVVDDEKGVLDIMGLILREAGYEVLSADSGYAAFSLLEKRTKGMGDVRVTLIIADWVMQGWDGIKLLSEIRASDFKAIPFILMSGAVTREQLEVAGRKGADSILLKPISREVVINKVYEVLKKRGIIGGDR